MDHAGPGTPWNTSPATTRSCSSKRRFSDTRLLCPWIIDGSGTVITLPIFVEQPAVVRLDNNGVLVADHVKL